MDRMCGGETKFGVQQVTNTALQYRLLSKYTAFVAFTQDVRVNPSDEKMQVKVFQVYVGRLSLCSREFYSLNL